MSEKNFFFHYTIPGLIGLLMIGLFEFAGFFLGADFYFYDLFFRLRGAEKTSDRIIVAAIDEKSLDKLGRWPISRHHYAEFLEKTNQASGVILDIILAEPSGEDRVLAQALARHPRVVIPVYLDRNRHLVLPSSTLGNPMVGHVHMEPGVDGTLREIFHTLIHDGKQLSSISSTMMAALSGNRPIRSDSFLPVKPASRNEINGNILQKDRMGINYYGPKAAFNYLSLSDILADQYPSSYFKDKIILLGLAAAGIDQDHLTCFSQNRDKMPGVEVQATVLNNLLDGSDIHTIKPGWRWGGIIPVFFIFFCLFVRMKNSTAAAGFLVSAGLLFFVDFRLFTDLHIWFPPFALLSALLISLLTAHIVKLEKLGRHLAQAKQNWEISFDAITDAVIISDRFDRIILSNQPAEQGARDFLGRFLKKKQAPSDGKNQEDHSLTGPCANPCEVYDEGLNRYFEVRSFSRQNKGKQTDGTVYVIRDMTEERNLKKEQKNLQAQLVQLQKMEAIGTLAGGIAHDFNNILSAIIGYTQLAAIYIPGEKKAREKLDEILKTCHRASDLIMQILSFSRRSDKENISFTLKPIVKEVVKLLKATLPPTIEIKEDIKGKEMIHGDPGRIYQVVLNLCTNASQALGEGPGQINVVVESVDIDSQDQAAALELQAGAYVRVTVSDTGPGIPEEIQSRIFEPYFTTKAKDTGTGLGLATAHGIVKNHRGCIRFESRGNQGATFRVYLPRVEIRNHCPEEPAMEAPDSVQGSLLFVDDRPGLVETSRILLENLGYEVTGETCPEQALASFQERPDHFDILITDLYMKKMTGLTLIEKIKSTREDIPVILCTGYNDQITKEIALDSGVTAFMNKPFSIQALSGKIQQIMVRKIK